MADMTIPQWYILQTVYGQEQSAQENLKQMIKINQMENEIFDVVLPQEEETVERNGKMKKVIKNKYPNYLFIHTADVMGWNCVLRFILASFDLIISIFIIFVLGWTVQESDKND